MIAPLRRRHLVLTALLGLLTLALTLAALLARPQEPRMSEVPAEFKSRQESTP